MSLLTKNAKMKRSQNGKYSRIYNWTIPAFQTKDGFRTCPMAGVCASGCYAKMGAYVWPKVYAKHAANLELTKLDSFIDSLCQEIRKVKADLIRIHDAGDFYSQEYLEKWCAIAKSNPNVQFYAYTKSVSMVKAAQLTGLIPANLTIIFSLGGKEDHLIDSAIDRHSRVFPSLEALLAAGYVDTSYDDTNAIGPNHRIGLVYHGNKGYQNTAWDRVA